jgi:uncharacterized membrane protein
MNVIFQEITYILVSLVEMSAALIIGIASLIAVFKSFLHYFYKAPKYSIETVRLQLARWLSLGLEFALAADIMRTGMNPTWNEIGQLAAIAILRTALNYFIQKEIDDAIQHKDRI